MRSRRSASRSCFSIVEARHTADFPTFNLTSIRPSDIIRAQLENSRFQVSISVPTAPTVYPPGPETATCFWAGPLFNSVDRRAERTTLDCVYVRSLIAFLAWLPRAFLGTCSFGHLFFGEHFGGACGNGRRGKPSKAPYWRSGEGRQHDGTDSCDNEITPGTAKRRRTSLTARAKRTKDVTSYSNSQLVVVVGKREQGKMSDACLVSTAR